MTARSTKADYIIIGGGLAGVLPYFKRSEEFVYINQLLQAS
jgi:hypothetical protein